MKKQVPIYMKSIRYAKEHGELEPYRASYEEAIACRKAIEAAIARHYRDNCLSSNAAAEVLKAFGYERVAIVLANTIRQKPWDGRFSRENRSWADTVPACDTQNQDALLDRSHPGLVDLFLTQVREMHAQSQEGRISFPALQEEPAPPEAEQASEPEKGPER